MSYLFTIGLESLAPKIEYDKAILIIRQEGQRETTLDFGESKEITFELEDGAFVKVDIDFVDESGKSITSVGEGIRVGCEPSGMLRYAKIEKLPGGDDDTGNQDSTVPDSQSQQ